MLKTKLAAAAVALVISAPALADRDHYRDRYRDRHQYYRHDYRPNHYVVQHHYRPAVVHRYHYYQPAPQPVYYQRVDPNTGALIVVGAVLGAVIGHHIATSY